MDAVLDSYWKFIPILLGFRSRTSSTKDERIYPLKKITKSLLFLFDFKWMNLLSQIGILGWLLACDPSKSSTELVTLCGEKGTQFPGEAFNHTLFFLTGNPKDGGALCGYESQKDTWYTYQIYSPGSFDPLLFSNPRDQTLFLVERFSFEREPSRITRFSSAEPNGGEGVPKSGFPKNIYDLALLSKGLLWTLGYDESETAVVSDRFDALSPWNQSPSPLKGSRRDLEWPKEIRPIFALSNSTSVFYVSQGFEGGNPTQAKLLRASRQSPNQIEEVISLKDGFKASVSCHNAFQWQHKSASQVMVSCNPQYLGPQPGQQVSLFWIDVSQDPISIKSLVEADGQDLQLIQITGWNGDSTQALVEERNTTPTDYKGTIKNRYWISPLNGDKSPENAAGGNLGLVQNGKKLIFTCVGAPGQPCLEKKWGIRDANASPGSPVTLIDTKILGDFLQFASPIQTHDF
jgi:hypothetical protein